MHPFPSILIQFGLIAAPVMALLFIKARVTSVIVRLVCAVLLALATGALGRYLVTEFGWQPMTKSGRMTPVEPQALFWILAGGILVVLLIAVFSRSHPHGTGSAGLSLDRLSESPVSAPPPDLPEGSLKARKAVFWLMTAIYGLALLAWPFVAFIALFIFGDKRGNPVLNVGMAASIWMYPLLFIIGCRWGHYRRNRSSLGVFLKTSVSLLSAIWYFLLPGGISLAWQLLTEKKVNIAELETRRSTLAERLDPIYQSKLDSIKNRKPEQDARKAIQMGAIAFLPSISGGDYFPGLDNSAEQRSMAAENSRVIAQSVYLSDLGKQLGDDPSHSIKEDSYFSPVYKQYLNAKFEYMEKFNRVILLHPPRSKK